MTLETFEAPAGAAQTPRAIELPAPTAWPIILAFGLSLVFAGLVTSVSLSILGAICAVAGGVGWFFDVLPHEKRESVPVADGVPTVATRRPQVARVECCLLYTSDRRDRSRDHADPVDARAQ